MNILKEVLRHQVYPATGCTEPVAVALCAAHAAKALGEPALSAQFVLDAGTYKNGMAVTLPNTDGKKGNLLAGAAGVVLARPELKMEILGALNGATLRKALRLIDRKKIKISVLEAKKGIYIEAKVFGAGSHALCRIEGSHTQVSLLEKDGKTLVRSAVKKGRASDAYKKALRRMTLKQMLAEVEKMDAQDMSYLRRGVEMNLAAARAGKDMKKVGYYLQELLKKGYLQDDVFSSSKIMTACAADARMGGLSVPVMSSGESGNQGIVAVLVPWSVGKAFKVDEKCILKSIGLSHVVNAYVKLFTGGLAPICGCAIAAGVGASAAIVYQRNGADIRGISLAVNNLISDLGGMLCDGAKSGCALKVVSSTDSAIRSAYMGMHHYGITQKEGFVGGSAEETIQNLARISNIGMKKVDSTIVDIMLSKQGMRPCAA